MIIVLMVILGALVVWLVEGFIEHVTDNEGMRPEDALIQLISLLKVVAAVGAVVMWAFSSLMIWYARKAIQTRSMPPAGSWVVKGQSIRVGSAAVWHGKVLIVLASLLAILGALEWAILWGLADYIQNGG